MVKRENDPWIIAKRSDMRELLIVVNQRNANLKEISGNYFFQLKSKKFNIFFFSFILYLDKVKQIFSTQFSNILLLE
jgi:hypothetical protein